MNCINCNTETEGKYCPTCGQRMAVKRITFKEGWHDFWARIYGFDGMFPRTLRDLTFRPGRASREFIKGNRVLYYGPVGYFFLMITLFLLVLSMMNVDFIEFMRGMEKVVPITQRKSQMSEIIQRFAADNLKLVAFLVIPFMAFSARYVFFRRSGFNYLENSILPFYALGHLYWLTMLSAVYYKVTGNLVNPLITATLSVLYIGFAYASYITYQSKLKVFFKGVMLYLFSQVMMFLVFVVLIIIWILLLAWLDPDTLQMFKTKA